MISFHRSTKIFFQLILLFAVAVLSGCGDPGHVHDAGESAEFAPLHAEMVEKGGHPALRPKKRAKKKMDLHGVDFSVPSGGFVHLGPEVRGKIDAGFEVEGAPDWSGVVIHSSGEDSGSAASLRYHHERVFNLDEGMAYHFVIGNGSGSADGEVEVGARWLKGKRGVGIADGERSPRIEVCLIGEFHDRGPTKAQLESLKELLAKFESRLGEFSAAECLGHDEVEFNRRPCPGRYFDLDVLKHRHGGRE